MSSKVSTIPKQSEAFLSRYRHLFSSEERGKRRRNYNVANLGHPKADTEKWNYQTQKTEKGETMLGSIHRIGWCRVSQSQQLLFVSTPSTARQKGCLRLRLYVRAKRSRAKSQPSRSFWIKPRRTTTTTQN